MVLPHGDRGHAGARLRRRGAGVFVGAGSGRRQRRALDRAGGRFPEHRLGGRYGLDLRNRGRLRGRHDEIQVADGEQRRLRMNALRIGAQVSLVRRLRVGGVGPRPLAVIDPRDQALASLMRVATIGVLSEVFLPCRRRIRAFRGLKVPIGAARRDEQQRARDAGSGPCRKGSEGRQRSCAAHLRATRELSASRTDAQTDRSCRESPDRRHPSNGRRLHCATLRTCAPAGSRAPADP